MLDFSYTSWHPLSGHVLFRHQRLLEINDIRWLQEAQMELSLVQNTEGYPANVVGREAERDNELNQSEVQLIPATCKVAG